MLTFKLEAIMPKAAAADVESRWLVTEEEEVMVLPPRLLEECTEINFDKEEKVEE